MKVLVEATELHHLLEQDNILIIDVGSPENYQLGCIPGAVYLPYSQIIHGQAPVASAMPSLTQLAQTFAAVGIDKSKHIIAYDDVGGCAAGRFLWTLAAVGFTNYSLLNGGRDAWQQAGFALSQERPVVQSTHLTELQLQPQFIADQQEILMNLDNPDYLVWDARGEAEYIGLKSGSARAGHIPGAIHLDWLALLTADRKLKPLDDIQELLNGKGLTADKTIATHCQTHRRSGLTWFVAHHLLGYQNIKGYPGSWLEWGNNIELPIET